MIVSKRQNALSHLIALNSDHDPIAITFLACEKFNCNHDHEKTDRNTDMPAQDPFKPFEFCNSL